MKINDLREKIFVRNPNLEFEIKKDLAFQVAKHLEEARLIKGLTQRELAKEAGTTQSNIARAENGNTLPSLSFLKRLADAFKTYLIPPRFAFMEESKEITVKSATMAGVETNEVKDDITLYAPWATFTSTDISDKTTVNK